MYSPASFLIRSGWMALLLGGGVAGAGFAAPRLALVAEKVPPVVADRQDAQIADRVHLDGWVGGRILANEANRLARLDPDRLL